jgi:4-hydroxy-3-methylbut-2-en-1-yl diphosphate reductase
MLIGFRKHDEVMGVVGEAPGNVTVIENEAEASVVQAADFDKVAVITQTTLSADETDKVLRILRKRFPSLIMPPQSDICYATTNRQSAVKQLAGRVRTILVLGSKNSSNSNRLAEVARAQGATVCLIDSLPDLDTIPMDDVLEIGLTAGASTPDSFVNEVISVLKQRGFMATEELVFAEENVHFPMPPQLRGKKAPDRSS